MDVLFRVIFCSKKNFVFFFFISQNFQGVKIPFSFIRMKEKKKNICLNSRSDSFKIELKFWLLILGFFCFWFAYKMNEKHQWNFLVKQSLYLMLIKIPRWYTIVCLCLVLFLFCFYCLLLLLMLSLDKYVTMNYLLLHSFTF